MAIPSELSSEVAKIAATLNSRNEKLEAMSRAQALAFTQAEYIELRKFIIVLRRQLEVTQSYLAMLPEVHQ